MKKGQKSTRGGYQDFLCPFTTVFVTQWDNGSYSHKGTKAYDVIGDKSGVRYPYYAPCDVKCVGIIPSYGQAIWQSIKKVRLANGNINYITFTTAHDNSFDAKVGQVIKQGTQLGNMGTKSALNNVTGVHCHLEIAYGKQTTMHLNKYKIYCFNNELTPSEACFMDGTVIKKWKNKRYLKDVPVNLSSKPISSKNNIVANGTYKLLYAKALRTSPKLGKNTINAKNVDPATKKLLVKPIGNAMLKAGTEIICKKISKERNGRIWGSYGNCWICLKDASGKMNVKKVK